MIRLSVIIIILLLIFTSSPSYIFAHPGHPEHDNLVQENTAESVEELASESAQMAEERVEYELPYPGMLPDNPLYFLKTFRDAFVRFLISDSLKKAEFNLLTSDKRIYASALLVEKDEFDLAVETLFKSNNYMHDAVVSLSKAREDDKDIKVILGNMESSVKKHKEVVSRQIMPHIPESMQGTVESELERLEDIEKSVTNLATE